MCGLLITASIATVWMPRSVLSCVSVCTLAWVTKSPKKTLRTGSMSLVPSSESNLEPSIWSESSACSRLAVGGAKLALKVSPPKSDLTSLASRVAKLAPGMGGAALPPGMGPYGNVSPTGNPLDVLSPVGLEAGRRTRTVKDAEALRDAQNIVLPTVRKFSEQAKKDDFQRSLAAEGIKANLLLNRNLTEGLAQATRQMGTTAAEQAGSALTTQYNY